MEGPPIIKSPAKSLGRPFVTIALILCAVILCYAVPVGYLTYTSIPPKDAKLIASFHAHQAAYERLREMLQADDQLRSVGRSGVIGTWGITTTNAWDAVSAREANFPVERYHEYVGLLKEVGGRFVVRRQGDHADPEIRLWSWGIGSTGGNIGICWEHQAPTNQVPSLAPRYAGRTADRRHKIAYRHIEANWYLWTDL